MKKTILLSLVFLVLALAAAAEAQLPPPASAQSYDLLAGQTQNIGSVKVWNDATTLYVYFDTEEGLVETHVHVGTAVTDIPQTKKGNPIPGQFDSAVYYPDTHLHEFDAPPVGTEVTIAAHAVTGVATLSECSSSTTTQVAGPLTAYAQLNSTDWGSYGAAVDCWVHGSWPSINGATWVSTAYYTEETVNDSWRTLLHAIDIPGVPIDANITATSDNAEEVYLNGQLIGSDGEVQGAFVDNHEWNTIIHYLDDGTNLLLGLNYLEFIVRNYAQAGGTATSNPTGLIYCFEINYYESGETAWGAGTQFPGRNWATYLTYTIAPTPCLTPSDSLSITGTGWKSVGAWCPCAYTYDLTATGEPIALQGNVDLSKAAVANTKDWSKYYAKFSVVDSSGRVVEVVFCNDWLGPWYEMPAQQWDRIRMENNMQLAQPLWYYATVGGVLGYDMTGKWVGAGNGATVYPSDGNYFFQLIADPSAETFTLQVYGMGSGAPANPPNAWPKQNMYDYPTGLEIGTIDVSGTGFDFTEVNVCAVLWASTQAGAEETTTIYWSDMGLGSP